MLIVKNLACESPSGVKILNNISFSIADGEKVALIGKNGIGKSTILKAIEGSINFSGAITHSSANIAYFPQKFNELNFRTVADVFSLEREIIALNKVEDGSAEAADYDTLDGKWDCQEYIGNKLKLFSLENIDFLRKFSDLSGGEKVKVILSAIIARNTDFLILDEPTNNMDTNGKDVLFSFIRRWSGMLLLVSHDRELLNLMDKIYELRHVGLHDVEIFPYGGNFDDYARRREIENEALEREHLDAIKQQKIRENTARKNMEKNVKILARAGRINSNGSITSARTLHAMHVEKKTAKVVKNAKEKYETVKCETFEILGKMDLSNHIYFKMPEDVGASRRILLSIESLNFLYGNRVILNDFNLVVKSGQKIAVNGKNGSGKSTLLKIISRQLLACSGMVRRNCKIGYLDQEYSILKNEENILENMRRLNADLSELECRATLAEFLFRTDAVYKPVSSLSGGEKIRVALACILNKKTAPELLLLDEPTNNLDLESISILESILNSYGGALAVVSHDSVFKKNIGVEEEYELSM